MQIFRLSEINGFLILERVVLNFNISDPILQKNEKKKLQFFSGKNANFATFLNLYFCSLQRLAFYLQLHQTLFLGLFFQKEKEEKISRKNANFATFLNRGFCRLNRLVFYLQRHQTPFDLFCQKKEEEKLSIFFIKTMV